MATAPQSNVTPPPAHPPTPATPNDTQEWYVAVKKKQRGPLSHTEVSSLISDRSLSPRSYIWKPGMPEWVRLGNLDTFHDALVVQRAQMALSEPSYAAYMAKIRGEGDDGGEDASVSVKTPDELARALSEEAAQSKDDHVESQQEAPQDNTSETAPEKTPESAAPEEAAAQPPEAPDEIEAPAEPKLEITDPRQMHVFDDAPDPGTVEPETSTASPPEDVSVPPADPAAAEPFDDTATIADEPLFTREALKRLDKKRGFRAMDTQISAPPDMSSSDVSQDDSSQTVDEVKRPQSVLVSIPDEPVEGYEGPAEPFPPFSTEASAPAPQSTAPDVHTSDFAMASTMADKAMPDVGALDDMSADMVETNDQPARDKSPFEAVEPTTDEQPRRDWNELSAESPVEKPAPETPEGNDAAAPSDDVLNIDDLLEESVPEAMPPAPPGPPPIQESKLVEAVAVEDKMVHRHTDEEMLALEGNFFDRAENHLQQEQALEQAVQNRMPDQTPGEDHHEAATAPVTDDEVEALVQSLGILVRRDKQSRRMSLLFSLLAAVIVIGVGVAGANSQTGTKKSSKRQGRSTSSATPATVQVSQGELKSEITEEPSTNRRQSERVTDLDWDEADETQGSKRNRARAKSPGSTSTQQMRGMRASKRKKPTETIEKDKLKQMMEDEIGRKGLVIAIETKTKAKKRRVNSEDINRLINAQMRHFKRCGRSNMPGMTLRLVFRINTEGSVDSIRTTPSTGPDRAVQNCVRNKVKTWRFRPLDEAQTFRRTLVF